MLPPSTHAVLIVTDVLVGGLVRTNRSKMSRGLSVVVVMRSPRRKVNADHVVAVRRPIGGSGSPSGGVSSGRKVSR